MFRIGKLRSFHGSSQAVTVTIPEKSAEELMKRGELKIGFNLCKITERIAATSSVIDARIMGIQHLKLFKKQLGVKTMKKLGISHRITAGKTLCFRQETFVLCCQKLRQVLGKVKVAKDVDTNKDQSKSKDQTNKKLNNHNCNDLE